VKLRLRLFVFCISVVFLVLYAIFFSDLYAVTCITLWRYPLICALAFSIIAVTIVPVEFLLERMIR